MIGGSQASMYYGEPRLTRDVDVIVALRPAQLSELLRRFPGDVYDRARLARRQRLPLAEGVMAYKLLFHRQVESGMHLRDVLGILRVSGRDLDREYIAEWAGRLGVHALWEQLRKQAE